MPRPKLARLTGHVGKLVQGAATIATRRLSRRRLAAAVREAQALERAWQLDEALARWQAIATAFPDAAVGSLGAATVLRQQNRCAEAGVILTDARQRFPHDLAVLAEQARIANQQGRFENAIGLTRLMVEQQVDRPDAYAIMAEALRELLRLDDAEAILSEGRRHCPRDAGIASQWCVVADARGDWPLSLERWQGFRRDFPDNPFGYAGVGAALKRLKRYAEADAALTAGMARFPQNSNLGVNWGWCADDAGDWEESLRRWGTLKERFPGDPRIRKGWIESQGNANLARADIAAEGVRVAAPAAAPADDEAPWRDLFMRFESLGENCVLGVAQRHFGAEPTGLLRWSGISYDKLLDGLGTGFAGVGTPEQTDMLLDPSNNLEYFTHDHVFGLHMHTFIMRDEVNKDRIYQKLCRRMQYLRDKLLDDFAAADKIFVFLSSRPVADDELRRLHAAMLPYGPVTLLVVQPTDGLLAPGSVRIVEQGLLAGIIDGIGFDGRRWNISFGLWLELCQKTAAIVDTWVTVSAR